MTVICYSPLIKTSGFKKTKARGGPTKRLKGLYQRGDVWWLAFTPANGGERQFVSLNTKNYEEAVRLGVTEKSKPQFQRADRISEERKRFIAAKKARGDYSRHTKEWSESAIKQFESFVRDIGARAVTGEHIENYWVALRNGTDGVDKVSENSAASYMRAIRAFFSWLVSTHRIPQSPFADFRIPKLTKAARIRFCEKELRDKLIDECEDWVLKFILYCGFHAGLRRMEIVEAIAAWFNLISGFVTVQKTPTFNPKDRDRRDVPLTTPFLKFLRESQPLAEPWVIKPTVKHGKALYRYDFRAPFEAYMASKGCSWVTPHVMRHTFGALYVSNGGSLFRLSVYMGDTPETTEKHYAHLVPDRDDIDRSHRPIPLPPSKNPESAPASGGQSPCPDPAHPIA